MPAVKYINSTTHGEIARELKESFGHYRSAHFTNGTYMGREELIVPTTLTGFQCATQRIARHAPLVIAVNSDKSMQALKKEGFEPQAVRAAEGYITRNKKISQPYYFLSEILVRSGEK